jgi:hypothetical protein
VLAAGMKRALDYQKDHQEIKHIIFMSDSSLAITNITSTEPHPCQHLSIFFARPATEFLAHEDHHITIQWIPGHQGHEINKKADKLAKKGCYLPQTMLPESISYHAEKKTQIPTKEWRATVAAKPYTGAFREVTFESPNPKPNLTFIQLEDKPEIFGQLTQIRTMHGYNISYFNRFHIEHEPECLCTEIIPPVPPSRICDHIFQNTKHTDTSSQQ